MSDTRDRPRLGALLLLFCLTAASEYTNTRRARAERRANANKTGSVPGAEENNPNNCLSAVRGYKFAERPPVRKAKSKPLTGCYEFSRNTCCTKNHTETIKWFVIQAAAALFNGRCRDLTEKMNCMVCDPDVGRGRVNKVCPMLCEQWYSACAPEWYNGKIGGGLVPCYGDALVCSQLRDITDNAQSFCQLMGFPVASANRKCYDGHAPITDGEAEIPVTKRSSAAAVFPEFTTSQYLAVYAAVLLVVLFSASRYLLQKLHAPEPTFAEDEGEYSSDSDEDDATDHEKFS